jgi:hypothetical protein
VVGNNASRKSARCSGSAPEFLARSPYGVLRTGDASRRFGVTFSRAFVAAWDHATWDAWWESWLAFWDSVFHAENGTYFPGDEQAADHEVADAHVDFGGGDG